VPQTKIIIEIRPYYCLHYIISRILHHITEESIFDADKIMVMGNYKNLRVFNFVI